MQRRFLKGGLLLFVVFSALLSLCACSVQEMSTLPQLSKPYVGLYECKTLRLGARELSGKYDMKLELKYGGDFILRYRDENGGEGGYSGKYEADCEAGEITFSAEQGLRTVRHTFPMEEGKIFVRYEFFGTLLYAEFSMP